MQRKCRNSMDMRRGYKSEDILRVMKCPDYLT